MTDNHSKQTISDIETPMNQHLVSDDGYIRLTLAELQSVNLVHLMSGLDEGDILPHDAAIPSITGYTEWVSEVAPQVSMGWDWIMEFVDREIQFRRIGELRSNLMIRNTLKKDLDFEKSYLLQELFVDSFNWQASVKDCINIRYR